MAILSIILTGVLRAGTVDRGRSTDLLHTIWSGQIGDGKPPLSSFHGEIRLCQTWADSR